MGWIVNWIHQFVEAICGKHLPKQIIERVLELTTYCCMLCWKDTYMCTPICRAWLTAFKCTHVHYEIVVYMCICKRYVHMDSNACVHYLCESDYCTCAHVLHNVYIRLTNHSKFSKCTRVQQNWPGLVYIYTTYDSFQVYTEGEKVWCAFSLKTEKYQFS